MGNKVYLATKDDLGTLQQPTGINMGEVGVITWQYTLLANHLKLDGTTVLGAEYPLLLAFAVDHELVTDDAANNVLFKYDDVTDVLTLPNLMDLCVQGGANVVEKQAGLPNITGTFELRHVTVNADLLYTATGAVEKTSRSGTNLGEIQFTNSNTASAAQVIDFNASNASPMYGASDTVQPPAVKLIPQIRYAADVVNQWADMVGHVLYDVVLRDGFIKANGATVEYASTAVPRLVSFVHEHSELLGDGAALYKYAEADDALTLPNFTARVLQGSDSVGSLEAGLPNATGNLQVPISYQPGVYDTKDNLGALGVFNGSYICFYNTANRQAMMINWTAGTITNDRFINSMAEFSLKKSNTIYGASTTVQPPAITLIPQIRY